MPSIDHLLGRIHQTDCLPFMRSLPDKCVDLVLCDLPYGTTACKWDTIIPFEPLWAQYKRVIKDNGAIVLTSSQPFTSALIMSNPDMFRYCWVWEKEQGVNFLSAKKNPMKVHEDILVFYLDEAEVKGRSNKFMELREYFNNELESSGVPMKELNKILDNNMGGHYFTDGIQWTLPTEDNYKKLQTTGFFKKDWNTLKKKYEQIAVDCKIPYYPQMEIGKAYLSGKGKSGDITGNVKKKQTTNMGTRYPRSVIKINRETGLHPTQKPVALFEYLIRTYTNEGDIVLDNCSGSGTTAIACINTKRRYICCELDSNYCDISNKRVADRLAENRLF